jgi:hypothetical protein
MTCSSLISPNQGELRRLMMPKNHPVRMLLLTKKSQVQTHRLILRGTNILMPLADQIVKPSLLVA